MSQSKAEWLYLKASEVHRKTHLERLQKCIPIMESRAEKGDFHYHFSLGFFKGIPSGLCVNFFQNEGFTCSEEEITDPDDPNFERGTLVLRVSWANPK